MRQAAGSPSTARQIPVRRRRSGDVVPDRQTASRIWKLHRGEPEGAAFPEHSPRTARSAADLETSPGWPDGAADPGKSPPRAGRSRRSREAAADLRTERRIWKSAADGHAAPSIWRDRRGLRDGAMDLEMSPQIPGPCGRSGKAALDGRTAPRIWESRGGLAGGAALLAEVARRREKGERRRARSRMEVYWRSVGGAGEGAGWVEAVLSGSGLSLRRRPRKGCMPNSASFSERSP